MPQRRVKGNLEVERGKPHKQETQILVEELQVQKRMNAKTEQSVDRWLTLGTGQNVGYAKSPYFLMVCGDKMQKLMQELLTLLKDQNLTLAVCESFTGGMFANEVTNIPGASTVFLGGYVTYSTLMKTKIGVKKRMIKKYGVVSQQVAEAMVQATKKLTKAHLVIAFTGNAGPTAEDHGQVGVAYFCFDYLGLVASFKFEKTNLSRLEFKKQAVLQGIREMIAQIQK